MNDKGWNEFWDDGGDEDDEFDDLGCDVDANNDETFDNAAEWNEDEHEELIARDSILSHTIRSNNNSSNNNTSINNTSNTRRGTSNDNNHHSSNNDRSSNNNTSNRVTHHALLAVNLADWKSTLEDKDPFPSLERQRTVQPKAQSSSEAAWQSVQSTSDRLQMLQLQQQQFLAQVRIHQEEENLRQRNHRARERELLEQRIGSSNWRPVQTHNPPSGPELSKLGTQTRQILRVDDLERQLLGTRISPNEIVTQSSDEPTSSKMQANFGAPRKFGWSPFGGKDLFTNPDSTDQSQLSFAGQNFFTLGQLPQSLTLEQQQQIILQQHRIMQQQAQMHEMALLKQQQIQQEQRLMSQNPQCFTVEELEKQMIASSRANRINNSLDTVGAPSPNKQFPPDTTTKQINQIDKNHNPTTSNAHDQRRESEKQERYKRYERDSRDSRDHRDNRRDHKDHHRDRHRDRDHRQRERPKITIIPPQVQLGVIDKAKLLHSITAMHPDEFLQDKMPTSEEGFHFKRHSRASKEKTNYDGVLNEKERNWLTKIQEKIQADYDDNLDQDYYYLLYFNRSSMTDEAAQKPCGPGVLDRRFIPRERLLYNSNT